MCPGLVATPWPQREFGDRFADLVATVESKMVTGRILQPDDIARVVVFLALDTVTGELLRVDGGMRPN